MNRRCQMKPNSDFVTGSGPQSSHRRHSGTSFASTIFGFTVNANQFQVLHSDQPVASPRSIEQRAEGLVDPRTTRQQRWTTRGTEEQETKTEEADVILTGFLCFLNRHYRAAHALQSRQFIKKSRLCTVFY